MPILNLGENEPLFFIVIDKKVNQKRKRVMDNRPSPVSFSLHNIPNSPDRLIDAHFVFDQCDAHVVIAVLSESEPG
jgi:hypothetical protein